MNVMWFVAVLTSFYIYFLFSSSSPIASLSHSNNNNGLFEKCVHEKKTMKLLYYRISEWEKIKKDTSCCWGLLHFFFTVVHKQIISYSLFTLVLLLLFNFDRCSFHVSSLYIFKKNKKKKVKEEERRTKLLLLFIVVNITKSKSSFSYS